MKVVLLVLALYGGSSAIPLTGKSTEARHVREVQTSPEPEFKSVADKMCIHYAKYVFKKEAFSLLPGDKPKMVPYCGKSVTPLVVGGEDAGPREFPHMVRIGYGENPEILYGCAGSLISERYVLSAAHCTKIEDKPYNMTWLASWANLGDLDISTEDEEADPVTLKIVEHYDHPSYVIGEVYHDIALYKLEKDAPLGIYIRPICLNTMEIRINVDVIATGWGRLGPNRFASNILQKVDLPLKPIENCKKVYKRQLPKGLNDNMLCAGGVTGKDTCKGDSGGPLQLSLEEPFCMYSVIGVTSFGPSHCGQNIPAVYTDVRKYLPWIEKIVWPNSSQT